MDDHNGSPEVSLQNGGGGGVGGGCEVTSRFLSPASEATMALSRVMYKSLRPT
jgi:hypothetical protein